MQVRDPRGFGPSLSACPKLEDFLSYKLCGLGLHDGSVHKLSLPKCASLTMCGSRDLNRIEIKAPKLERLDLQVLEAHRVSACALAPTSSLIAP